MFTILAVRKWTMNCERAYPKTPIESMFSPWKWFALRECKKAHSTLVFIRLQIQLNIFQYAVSFLYAVVSLVMEEFLLFYTYNAKNEKIPNYFNRNDCIVYLFRGNNFLKCVACRLDLPYIKSLSYTKANNMARAEIIM